MTFQKSAIPVAQDQLSERQLKAQVFTAKCWTRVKYCKCTILADFSINTVYAAHTRKEGWVLWMVGSIKNLAPVRWGAQVLVNLAINVCCIQTNKKLQRPLVHLMINTFRVRCMMQTSAVVTMTSMLHYNMASHDLDQHSIILML